MRLLNGDTVLESWTDYGHELTGLQPNITYTIQETSAYSGYRYAYDTQFKFNDSGEGSIINSPDARLTCTYLYIKHELTQISVLKTDASGAALSGAEMVLKNSSGGLVSNWTSGLNAYSLRGLDVGETYTLSETTTPAGYKPAAPVTFVLANDGTIDTNSPDTTAVVESGNLIKFKNDPTSFNIYVVDMEHPETKISGANVSLRIRNGSEIHGWTSDTNAKVVTGLTVGTEYVLRTKEPYPSDYIYSWDEVFRVKADGTAEPVEESKAAYVDENGDILVRMLKIYKVRLKTNGGTINSGNVTQYAYSSQKILPTDVTNGNLRFGGWYENDDFSGEKKELITASDTGNKTFYAKWE